jgi:hypothetical protein
MTEAQLHRHCWDNVLALDPDKIAPAVAMLARRLKEFGTADEVRERIIENRIGWLGGRKNIQCYVCTGDGLTYSLKPEIENTVPYDSTTLRYDDRLYEELLKVPENRGESQECWWCKGKKICDEMPLHHGFGTQVRNLLRSEGYGEKYFGIDNLDDFYSALIEMAMGFAGPVEV